MPGTHKKGPMGYHKKGSTAYHKKGSTAYHGPKAMYDKEGPTGHMHMGPKAMKSATKDGGQIAAKDPSAPAKQIEKLGAAAMYGPKAHHGPKAMKSKQRVEQDYARNVIHDKETGHNKAAAYEKKKLTQVAAGEGYFTRHKWHHKAFKGR